MIVIPAPMLLSAVVVAYLLAARLAAAAADDLAVPPTIDERGRATAESAEDRGGKKPCVDCAVVRSIRQVQRERPGGDVPTYMTSPQYLEQRRYSEPTVGPIVGFSFGPGSEGSRPFVGAAGSSTMRNRILTIVYQVTLRYDDDRMREIEVTDIDDLRVGDRARVVDNRVEKVRD